MDPAIAPPPPVGAAAPPAPHGHVADDRGAAITRRQRLGRAGGLASVAAVTAYVGLVDPSSDGVYPLCPSRSLFGIDCPACGGLRGTHDLLRGDIAGALDHNLLLPLLLVIYGVAIGLWLRPLIGRAVRPVRVPRWVITTGIAVAVGFTVLRNIPVDSLEFLASSAEW